MTSMNQKPLKRQIDRYPDLELVQIWVQEKARHQRGSDRRLATEFLRFVGKPLAAVTLADVLAYAKTLSSRRIAASEAQARLRSLKSLFAFGYRMGALPINIPLQKWPRVRQKRRSPIALSGMESLLRQLGSSWRQRLWRSPRQKLAGRWGCGLGLALCLAGLGWTISGNLTEESPAQVQPPIQSPVASQAGDRVAALKTAYVKAFLDTIAWAEGTQGPDAYRMQFTGSKFSSFADHPRQINCGWSHSGRLCSDAAGRYQFLSTSWDRMARKIGANDFSPPNQDRAAIAMLEEYGVLADIEAGSFEYAAIKLIPVWPSLRDVGNGSRATAIARLQKVYQQNLEKYHPGD